MFATYSAIVLLVLLSGAVAVAYLRFRRIGSTMSAVEFFSRLLRGSGFANVSPADLRRRLASADAKPLLIDLREPDHFERESIVGAVSRPFDDFLREAVVDESYDKDQEMILVCDGGHMSRVAADILVQDEGFTRVTNLAGGMKAWQKYERSTNASRCCVIRACC